MDPIQLPKIRRKALGDQLVTRLLALPGPPAITVYRGEVSKAGLVAGQTSASGQHPPLLTADGDPDPSGRVGPYVVVYDAAGSPNLEPSLGGCGEQLRWTPQTTVVAGFSPDCAQAVDRVFSWLYHWSPALPGVAAGWLEPPPGYDPGPPRRTTGISPDRWWMPLQWRIDLTT